MDRHIFRQPDNGYMSLAGNLWIYLFSMYELTEIMRQADNKPFAELLNRLREGNQSHRSRYQSTKRTSSQVWNRTLPISSSTFIHY